MLESSSTSSPLILTEEQIEKLRADTDNGTANPLKGYQDMIAFLDAANTAGTDTLDDASQFWYQQAITVNGNDPTSFGNIFIHAATAYGAAWDGKTVDFQSLSNKIGLAVINGTIESGTLQSINSMLEDDIGTSLSYGGMTVGGWGGSFYYWDTPFEGTETVGQAIMADPEQYDKFIATTANAIVVTGNTAIEELGLSFSSGSISNEVNQFLNILQVGVPTIVSSSVQTSVKAEVIARAFEEDVLGQSAAGNPNLINGYQYVGKNWFGNSEWIATANAGISSVNVTDTKELDALRTTRLDEQGTKSGDAVTNIYSALAKATNAGITGSLTLPSELQLPAGSTLTASDLTSSKVTLNLPALPTDLVTATIKDVLADIAPAISADFLAPVVSIVGTGLTDAPNFAGNILTDLTGSFSSTSSHASALSSTQNHVASTSHQNLFASLFS
ncbi:hypothetical protein [Acetobacter sp.]|uniref:hypothetical protein n=1 Tax=Acetobacter sp. TaxID=440 RepID=UPI0025B84481|nr:hypothetical protein [Acetobacter sp.]MCH4091277.1 hypothetical protein [Acetobacter sp.]MCI1300828.1 hypothetical protein [Acetobacter sp.]MCI1317156.1 hypothetical protein [Acetobacter sp.]